MADIDDIKQLQDEFKKLNEQVRAAKGQYFEDIPKTVNDLKSSIKFLSDELASLKTTFGDLSKIFKNTLDDLKGFDSTSSSINKSFRTLGGLADKLRYDSEGITDLNKKDLISLQTRAKIEVSNLKTQRQALDAQFKGKDLDEKRAEAIANDDKGLLRKLDQYNELIKIIDEEGNLIESNNNYIIEFNRLLDERLKKEKEYEKTIGGLSSNLLKGLSKIPIIGDMLDIEGAQKAMKNVFDSGGGGFAQLSAGASTLGASLQAAMGPLALIMMAVKAIKALVGAMFEVDKQVTSLAKNLSISKDEAQDMRKYFAEMSNDVETQYNLTKDLIEAQLQLSNLSKFTILFSKSTLDNQVALTKEIGLSEEEASNLNRSFSLNNVEGNKGTDIVFKRIAAFANENKIIANGKKILQDVSKVSGQILLNFRGNLPALVDAVLQASRLGVTLEQSRNVSNSLLDFESSINNELEASVFLGRRFNLDRAKALALEKDYVGATQEVLKQVGSIEEFQSMSAIHQQVVAKAAGMTVDELSESLMYQQYLTDEQKQQYDRFKAAGQEDIAQKLAAGKIDKEEIENALKSLDAQEKFNIALDKAKEAFTNIVSSGTLDMLVDALKQIADYVASITGNTAKYQQAKASREKQDIIQSLPKAKPEEQAKLAEQLLEQKKKSQEVIEAEPGGFKKGLFTLLSRIGSLGTTSNMFGIQDKYASMSEAAKNAQKDIDDVNKQLEGMGDVGKAALKSVEDLEDAERKAAAMRYGAGMSPVTFAQKVEDGVSIDNDGPFEITNRYGETAITTAGDKLAVGPNINNNPSSPTLDLTPFINAFTSFKNEVVTAMSRPQPAPTFVFEGNGTQLGKFVGSQMETGTAQNISTGYTIP
jgi:hypothetical protein